VEFAFCILIKIKNCLCVLGLWSIEGKRGTSLRENGNFFCCQSICSVPLLCLPFLEVGGICLFVSLSAMQIFNADY
jgi:hypothetical protein